MFVTSADLPIDGRAARTMRLPGWKPPVIASRSAKPGRGAGELLALGRELLPLADLGVQDVADLAEVLLAIVVGDLEDRPLGALDEVARLAVVAVDGGLDVVGRREQPAQERAVLDQAAVVAQRADARRRRGERVDLGLAAGLLELAARAQVLGEREHVDRLAGREQREDGLEDRAVPLAVEVFLPQRLLDDVRVVGAIRLQDRAEDGLLGLDRVGRNGAHGGPAVRVLGRGCGAHRVLPSKPRAPAGRRPRPRKWRAICCRLRRVGTKRWPGVTSAPGDPPRTGRGGVSQSGPPRTR
jgi:hypothetical protein